MRDLIHDPKLLRELLRNRLIRSAYSAVSALDRAARNKHTFVNDEYKSAVVLARIAPHLIADLKDEEPNQFFDVDFWYPPRLAALDKYGHHSREENAAMWVQSFKVHGPTENYKTIQEAREYGRRRWDQREQEKSEANRRYEECTLGEQLNESPVSSNDLDQLEN